MTLDYLTFFITEIDTNMTVLRVSDGTTSGKIRGDGWLISTMEGNITTYGGNLFFGTIISMYSHSSKTLTLSPFLVFLQEYCNYYQLTNKSVNILHYDNKKVVNKLSNIIKKNVPNYYQMLGYELTIAINHLLTKYFRVTHFRRH